jgi:regulator of nucleoside diphosphate kinase
MPSVRFLIRGDRDRVRRFISLHEARLAREEEALALLSARLDRARLIEPAACPDDVVTMHSQVRMRDADSGRLFTTTVALPPEDEAAGGQSLLRAYPRIALLGARVGDDLVWRSGGRLRRARIEQILTRPGPAAARVGSSRSRSMGSVLESHEVN